MTLTVGSLFSGIGGLDLGLERAGMTVAWQCEIDKAASTVLARHWPNVPNIGDVRDAGHSTPSVDVICGGFPCQDVSVAGRRAGLAGERSGLWFEFRRIVGDLRPRWVVIENVPGLLSSNGGRDFAAVLRGLVECGYGVAWRVLDAQYFGVPQRRRRVFLVGSLGDGRAAQVLFERESGAGDTPPRRETGARVARALANGSSTSGVRYDPNGEEYVVAIQDVRGGTRDRTDHGQGIGITLAAETMYTLGAVERHAVAHTLCSEGAGASEDGTGRGVPLVTAFAWQQGDDSKFNANGRGRSWVARAGDYAAGLSANRYDAIAGPGYGVRRLTPVECERLQGFEDDWTAGQSDSTRYRQLGNAVAVPVAAWIARRIVAAEREVA